MKVKKESGSGDNDDKLTIEDVIQLGGDQVGIHGHNAGGLV